MSQTISLFKRPLLIGLGLVMAASLVLAPLAYAQSSTTSQRDCDDNAILKCGAYSSQEVNEKYTSQPGAKAIFSVFGINESQINQLHSSAVSGYVTKGGRVLVNGETVANGAITAGRQNMPGSEAVKLGNDTFYMRPPSVSFNQDKLDAYVIMSSGKFQYAIIKSCGNPVKATPVEKPQPVQQQPPAVQPTASSGECRLINLTLGQNRHVSITVNSGTVNAQVIGYTIDFGDSTAVTTVGATNTATPAVTTNSSNNATVPSNTTNTHGTSSSTGSGAVGNTPNTTVPNDPTNPNRPPTSTSSNNTASTNNATNNSSSTTVAQATTSTSQVATHSYAQDGTFTITASVQIRHPDGRTETKTSEACKIPVVFAPPKPIVPAAKTETPPPAPQSPLPATGTGDVLGVSAAVGLASTFGYFFYGWLRSRLYLL